MQSECQPCDGIEPRTPESVANRPGLRALCYRAGRHGTFLESMIAGLSAVYAKRQSDIAGDYPDPRSRPSPPNWLLTRETTDPTIAFLDAWATVGDVLTFYQERIANEGYLKTARERRSLHELANQVGYQLRPALSASVYLAFDVQAPPSLDEKAKVPPPHRIWISKGTQAKSIPEPGKVPAIFETAEDLEARPEWNLLNPRLTKPVNVNPANAGEADSLWVKGVDRQIKSNDMLLITFGERLENAVHRSVEAIEPDSANDRTVVTLQPLSLSKKQVLADFEDPIIALAIDVARQEETINLDSRLASDLTSFKDKVTLLHEKVKTQDVRSQNTIRQLVDLVAGDSESFHLSFAKLQTHGDSLSRLSKTREAHQQTLTEFLADGQKIRGELDSDPKSVREIAGLLGVAIGEVQSLADASPPTATNVNGAKTGLTRFADALQSGPARTETSNFETSLDPADPVQAKAKAKVFLQFGSMDASPVPQRIDAVRKLSLAPGGSDLTLELARDCDAFSSRIRAAKDAVLPGGIVVGAWADEMLERIAKLRKSAVDASLAVQAAIPTDQQLSQATKDIRDAVRLVDPPMARIREVALSLTKSVFAFQKFEVSLAALKRAKDTFERQIDKAIEDLIDQLKERVSAGATSREHLVQQPLRERVGKLRDTLRAALAIADSADEIPAGDDLAQIVIDRGVVASFSRHATQKPVVIVERILQLAVGDPLFDRRLLSPPYPRGGLLQTMPPNAVSSLSAIDPEDPGIKRIAEEWNRIVSFLDGSSSGPVDSPATTQPPASGFQDLGGLLALLGRANGGSESLQLGTLFDAQSDLLAQFHSRLSGQERLHDILRSTKAAPPSFKIHVFSTKAALFGHNALSDGNASSGPGGAVTTKDSLMDGPGDLLEQDSRLILDGDVSGIVQDSLIIAIDGTQTVRSRVKSVVMAERKAYGLTGKCTIVDLEDPAFALTTNRKPIRTAVVYCVPRELTPAEEPISTPFPDKPTQIELPGIVDGLKAGRTLLVTGRRLLTDNGQDFAEVDATVAIQCGGTSFVRDGESFITSVSISGGLNLQFRRETVRIYANVVLGNHGETQQEVLGSGEGQGEFQQFALSQRQLTYLPEATPTGMAPQVSVLVNDVAWERAEKVGDMQPEAGEKMPQEYLVTVDDDQRAVLTTGDGKTTGERLPTGVANVKVKYRVGGGTTGNVKEGTITQLPSPPLNVTKVRNLLPASGGVDRENVDQARGNIPVAAMALDRLLSMRDYESFVRKFAGIAKAEATPLMIDGVQTVVVTIAGLGDAPIERDSLLFTNLDKALRRHSDPEQSVILLVRELMLLILKAKVKILSGHLWDTVRQEIGRRLLREFDFEKARLGGSVLLSDIVTVIQETPGVRYVDVDVLDRMRQFYGPRELVRKAACIAASEGPKAEVATEAARTMDVDEDELIVRQQGAETVEGVLAAKSFAPVNDYLISQRASGGNEADQRVIATVSMFPRSKPPHPAGAPADGLAPFPAQLAYFTDLPGTILLEQIP